MVRRRETRLGLLAREALPESLPEGIVVLDRNRRVHGLNRAARHILGAAAADAIDKRWEDVIGAAGVRSDPLVTGGPETVTTPAGRYEVHVTSLGDAASAAGQLVILRDVTALARALDERLVAQEQVIQQERLSALGQMAAGIAHDLDNTLGQVALYAGMLSESPDLREADRETRDFVELIRAGVSDAMSVIGRIREFYRPRGEHDVFAPADLEYVVGETIALTRPRWHDIARADGRTITVEVDLQPVPLLLVDAAALREALTNLIFNAVDALPQGGRITIQLRSDEHHAVLAVRDNGIGMTPEQQARCLEPFYTTKGVHGTGLGLSMVLGIARRHGGTVEIESEPGQGTWVAMYLRVRQADVQADVVSTDTPAAGRAAAKGAGAGRAAPTVAPAGAGVQGPRALVVDDETPMRNVIATLLARDGYAVDTAPDGATALQMINAAYRSSRRYDVLLTDQIMPGMSGARLAKTVLAFSPRLPVVMVTAFAYLMEGSPLPPGVDALVSKPFDAATLRSGVRTARAAHASGAGAAARERR